MALRDWTIRNRAAGLAEDSLHGRRAYRKLTYGSGAFALDNIKCVASAGLNNVVRCTVVAADIEHCGAMIRACAAFFGRRSPVRSIVPFRALHHGAKVEIEAVVAVAY